MTNPTLPKGASFAPVRPDNPGDASFPHQLPIELAMGLNPVSEICSQYGLTKEQFAVICQIPQFVAAFEWAQEEKLKPGGMTRLQCAMMTDEAVRTLYSAMTDVDNHINQRAAHAKDIIRLAGHEPAKAKETVDPGEKFAINIVFGSTGTNVPAIEGAVLRVSESD